MESPHEDDSMQNLVPDQPAQTICRSSFPNQQTVPKNASAHSNTIPGLSAMESHLTKANIKFRVILSWDLAYLKTVPGILKLLMVIISVVALITVTTSGGNHVTNSYLLLPRSAFLRLFVFTATSGFMTSFLFLFLQVTGLIKLFQFNWHFVDIVVYSCYTLMYMGCSALILSNLVEYLKTEKITSWTNEQILLTGVLGFICSVISCILAINGYCRYRGSTQFRRFRLQELERLDRLNNLETV